MTKLMTVLISWLKMSPLSLAAFGRRTVSFMQSLAIFATPAIDYGSMLKMCQRVENAWANRDNGPVAAQELIDSLSDLDTALHSQATFVGSVALGDQTTIVSSGFEHTKIVGSPSVKPETPGAPDANPIGTGKMNVIIPHQNGVSNNVIVVFLGEAFALPVVDNHIVFPSGPAGVIIMPIAHTHEQISGLTPGTKVTVVVFSYNAAGLSDASKPTSTFII